MGMRLHTAKTYKVEFADRTPIIGYGDCDEFVSWVKKTDAYDGDVFINESEDTLELSVDFLKNSVNDERWGNVIKAILEDMDKDNNFAYIQIF